MKTDALAGAKNAYQRETLSRRLDAQLLDATGTITAHTANQATAWQINTVAARSDLNGRQAIMDRDDPAKLDGMLAAAETVGQEKARLTQGAAPDSDIAKDFVLKEKEKILVGVIQAKITDGNKRAALALYDKYPELLKHNANVDSVMKGVRTEIDGENVANDALRKAGLPQIRSGESGGGNKDQFIQNMTPHALQVSKETGLDPRLVIAQSALETGYGRLGPRQQLLRYQVAWPRGRPDCWTTTEAAANGETYKTSDSFRTYASMGESASDYAQFLKSNSRYAPVLAAKGLDAQIDAMGKSGYATDPNYTAKLRQIASTLPEMSGGASGPFGGTIINSRFGTPGVSTFKGDIQAGYQQAKSDIANRTDLSPEVRNSAIATLNSTAANVTSYQTAATKALKDEADSYRLTSYLSPQGADPAKMASFAARADALGEQSLASTYRVLAAVAPTATNGLQSMPADQLKMLKSMEEGPAKKLLEGIEAGRGDALTKANDLFTQVKKAQADGVDPTGLGDMAKQSAQFYADAGRSEKAREVAQTYSAMIAAGTVLKGDPVAQKQALAELEGIASRGQANEEQVVLHGFLKDGIAKQAAEFKLDAFGAGLKLYGLPTLPLTDGTGRMEQVSQIASKRGLRPDQIAAMTDEEFAALRSQAGASPQAAQRLFQSIAASYPPEAIPMIGAGLAGKEGVSDPVSRGYAAALSFYADGAPEIAASILDGVAKRKEMGDALRNMPKSDAFFGRVQTKMGTAFKSLPDKVPAIIVNAAEAIYTSKMVAAGKQGEKAFDDTHLRCRNGCRGRQDDHAQRPNARAAQGRRQLPLRWCSAATDAARPAGRAAHRQRLARDGGEDRPLRHALQCRQGRAILRRNAGPGAQRHAGLCPAAGRAALRARHQALARALQGRQPTASMRAGRA
jgi:flagellum-specific peptidoglycan hydrolase FlgJ